MFLDKGKWKQITNMEYSKKKIQRSNFIAINVDSKEKIKISNSITLHIKGYKRKINSVQYL